MQPENSNARIRPGSELSKQLFVHAGVTTPEPAAPEPARASFRSDADAELDRVANLTGDARVNALRLIVAAHPDSDRALRQLLEALRRDSTAARRDEACTVLERWVSVHGLGEPAIIDRIPARLLEFARSGRSMNAVPPPDRLCASVSVESYADAQLVDVALDLRTIAQQPEPAERARRLRDLEAKYPSSADVCLHLARAARASGDDAQAGAAIEEAVRRMRRPCPLHELNLLHEVAQDLEPLSIRTAAYEALLAAEPDHGPSLHGRIVDLIDRGRFHEAGVLLERACADPTFFDRLPEHTRKALAERPFEAAPSAVGPAFPRGEYRDLSLRSSSPRGRMYDAVAADGRPVTLVQHLGHDPELLHQVLLDLQTRSRSHPLIARQRAIAVAADGSELQVFDRIRGQVFADLHGAPIAEHDAATDIVWYVALAVGRLHDDGHVIGVNPYNVIVLDSNFEQRIIFLDTGFDVRRLVGKPPLLTEDPFPLGQDRTSDERHRDIWGLGVLIYRAITGRQPPSPYHERELTNLPNGRVGHALRRLMSELLNPLVVPHWGSARRVATALDGLFVWKPPAVHAGARVGPWILQRRIAEGGDSSIWRAWSPTHGEAALKILRDQCSRDGRRSIAREVQLPRHDGLPSIIETGRLVAPDGELACYAMELLHGGSLDGVLARATFDLARAVTLACQLVPVLRFVHASGIIHGDIKPSNVYLEHVETDGDLTWRRVKLLDFAASQPIGGDPVGHARRTGTPSYAPPESWGVEPLTTAADTYSLAILLYEVVTGTMPFVAASEDEWHRVHETLPLPPHPLLDACPGLAALLRAMSDKVAARRLHLDEVEAELLRLATVMRLPFLQRTIGRPMEPPARGARDGGRTEANGGRATAPASPPIVPPPPTAPPPSSVIATSPSAPGPVTPAGAAVTGAHPRGAKVVVGASLLLFGVALAYYLTTRMQARTIAAPSAGSPAVTR